MTGVLCTTQSLHGMASIGCEMGAISGTMPSGRRPRLRSHLIFLMNDESENSSRGKNWNWIRLEICCSPLTLCEIAGVFAQWPMPSTNTTANIMKGARYNEMNSGDIPKSNSERIVPEPNVEAKYTVYIYNYIQLWYDICSFVKNVDFNMSLHVYII